MPDIRTRSSVSNDNRWTESKRSRSKPHSGGTSWRSDLEQSRSRRRLIDACWRAGRSGDPAVFRILLRTFGLSRDPAVVWEAARSIGLLGNKRAIPPVVRALRRGPLVAHRTGAVVALTLLNARQTVPELISVLENRTTPALLRDYVAEALGIFEARQAETCLLRLLRDRSPRVRASAAFALGRIGNKKTIEHLQEYQAHETAILYGQPIRNHALRAIQSIRSRLSKGSANRTVPSDRMYQSSKSRKRTLTRSTRTNRRH